MKLPCELLENLIHLKINFDREVSWWDLEVTLLNKNIRYLSVSGKIGTSSIDFDEIEDDFGFPELKTLLIRDKYDAFMINTNTHTAFRYMCENSNELEDICFAAIFHEEEDYEHVTEGIGYLEDRPSLRELTIECWKNYSSELFNDSIMELFNCPVEKPLLRKLVLDFDFSVFRR